MNIHILDIHCLLLFKATRTDHQTASFNYPTHFLMPEAIYETRLNEKSQALVDVLSWSDKNTTWTMENPPWHEMSWNVDECSVLFIGGVLPEKKHWKNLMIGVRTVGEISASVYRGSHGGSLSTGLPPFPPPCLSCGASGLRNMAWDI